MSRSAAGATLPGTAALPEDGRVDFAALRADRRRRLLEAMAAQRVDALVLGRGSNIAFASGVRSLWTSGSRPFGPGCIVVAGTQEVHLLSTWDEGVPPEIPQGNLFGLSWNPANLMGNLMRIPGLSGARRVATDGWSPGAAGLVGALAPEAEVVDGTALLSAARRVKSDAEVSCIRTAAAVAEGALTALVSALRPGVTERELVGVHAEAIARAGLPTPPTEAVACATPRRGPVRLHRLAGDRPVAPGELVCLSAGALYAGYEATLSRTWLPAGSAPSAAQERLAARAQEGRDVLVAACRPGADGAALAAAWRDAGLPPSGQLLAWGVGVGMEAPLVSDDMGAGAGLESGMVLAVQSWVAEEGAGGSLESDLVRVTPDGPELLTRFGPCPALGGAF